MITNGVNMFFAINSKLCKNSEIKENYINNNLIEISCCKHKNDCSKKIIWDINRWGIGINAQDDLIKKIKKCLCYDCITEKNERIKGRRLTNLESSLLNNPDLHMFDDKVFEDVLQPFMQKPNDKENKHFEKQLLYKSSAISQIKFRAIVFCKNDEKFSWFMFPFHLDETIKKPRISKEEEFYEYEHFEILRFKRPPVMSTRGHKCDLIVMDEDLKAECDWIDEFVNCVVPGMLTPQKFCIGIQYI